MFLGNKQTEKEVKTILISIGFVFYLFCILNGWLGSESKYIIKADKVDVQEEEENALEVKPEPLTIEEKIVKEFGENGETALAIATAESHLNPETCHIDEREYSCGLFQINIRAHHKRIPGNTFEEKANWLKNPENNISTAKDIFEESYWWPWSVFKNGRFKKFLEIE